MSGRQVFRYSKKSAWSNLLKVLSYVLVPIFLLLVLLSAWGNFYYGLGWADFLQRLWPSIRLAGAGAATGIVLGFFLRQSLRIEIDENGISIRGWGQPQLTIPFNEISEIKESKWDVITIISESLGRQIQLSPSSLEPNDYQVVKGTLEAWQEFAPPPPNELIRPLMIWSGLFLFFILFPILFSSPNRFIMTLPFLMMTIFVVILLIVAIKKQEGPLQRIGQISMAFLAIMSALMTVVIFLGAS